MIRLGLQPEAWLWLHYSTMLQLVMLLGLLLYHSAKPPSLLVVQALPLVQVLLLLRLLLRHWVLELKLAQLRSRRPLPLRVAGVATGRSRGRRSLAPGCSGSCRKECRPCSPFATSSTRCTRARAPWCSSSCYNARLMVSIRLRVAAAARLLLARTCLLL